MKGKPTHPYHSFATDDEEVEKFSALVELAFDEKFRVNRLGKTIHGMFGPAPDFNLSSQDYEKELRENMMPIEDLGDGIKCFVGILLNLESNLPAINLIDEPEAFLHPPQARRLGAQLVKSTGSGSQLFAATHSSDILNGALGENNHRVRILYVNHRTKSSPMFEIDPASLREISRDPILMHTDLLDSIFYEKTVLCEAEADIQFYSFVLSQEAEIQPKDLFWFATGGKHAMPKVTKILSKLGVDPTVIFDTDVLLTDEILVEVTDTKNANIGGNLPALKRAIAALKPNPAAEVVGEISTKLENSLGDQDKILSEQETEDLVRDIKRTADKMRKSWALKHNGIEAFSGGDDYAKVVELVKELAEQDIVVLKHGEMESYVKAAGGHGPKWVADVIENRQKYTDEIKKLAGELEPAFR